MPMHDWTRVDAGIFHDFHQAWNAELRRVLNGGLLPADFYALIEQHAGRNIPDLLTLHVGPAVEPLPSPSGGVAVAEVRPKISRRLTTPARPPRRSIAIRHVSGHRLVALIEIVSPANKDRAESVRVFANKVAEALYAGVHVLMLDLFPPGRYDPNGLHGAVWSHFDEAPYDVPPDQPLTVASYLADASPEAWLEHLAAGDELPAMPLCLTADVCICVPLEATYGAAFATEPRFWREVLEGRSPSVS
jgi:Protein of unknown function (DUF4058)